jgi:AcrR family transcriptional regulator
MMREPSSNGDRRSAKRNARWQMILDAAATLFTERGFEATTMQDIADRVGLLAPSLYHYVESKDELLYKLSVQVTTESLHYIAEDDDLAAADAPTRLTAFIERWMKRIDEAQPRAAYVAVERHYRSLRPEQVAEIRHERNKYRAYLHAILDQGVAEGDFDPDTPQSIVINTIFQLMWTTAVWFKDEGPSDWHETAQWYSKFLVRGIRNDGREPRIKSTPARRARPTVRPSG